MSWIHSSRLHVVLYSLLLVATPFVLLQNFLQQAIGTISVSSVEIAGHSIPIVPSIAVILLIGVLIVLRSRLKWHHILAAIVALVMIGLAQQITDYYFDHNFYDLQQNWHYFAYCLFAFMMYRDLAPRGHALADIMLITFVAALFYSSFDEAFQMHMSSRIFDVSDIAKDVWGTTTGMVVLFIGAPPSRTNSPDTRRVRHRRFHNYAQQPLSLLVLLILLSFFGVVFSSLLSEKEYWDVVIILTAGTFVLTFFVIHLSQFRWPRYVLIGLAVIAIVAQAYSYFSHRGEGITYNRYGLTVYEGIPVPFFDLLVFPDGSFRPVDKKHYFNYRDRTFLLKQNADIILLGSGSEGMGGHGFPLDAPNQFIYNWVTQKATQVIILNTPEACRLFNRLKLEGKNVLLVLHNTC